MLLYNSNDITWLAPGRKDRVLVREIYNYTEVNKEKRTDQTRYMLMPLKKPHIKFVKEHPKNESSFG